MFDCLDYGSPAARKRIYFLAVRLQEGMQERMPQLGAWATSLLHGMATGQGKAEDFIKLDMVPSITDGSPCKKARQTKDFQFYDEHANIYKECGLRYPPNLHDHHDVFVSELSVRAQERRQQQTTDSQTQPN